jgi:hypothetical protein
LAGWFLAYAYVVSRAAEFNINCLLLLVIAVTCLIGSLIRLTYAAGLLQRREAVVFHGLAAVVCLPLLAAVFVSPNAFMGYTTADPKRLSPAAIAISRHADPHSRVVVWGWAPEYYVQTRTVPATRDVVTSRQIEGPWREHYRQRFISEIRSNPPEVFVDAVGANAWKFKERMSQAHESFPELASFIQDQYSLQEEVAGNRIYKRSQ